MHGRPSAFNCALQGDRRRLGRSYGGTFGMLSGGDLRAIVERATPVVEG
ncbi:hypothetical protein [Nocardioides sp. LHG3406-4]